MDDKRWIYDIEIYPNLFLLCAKNVKTKKRVKFQVSPISNDRSKLIYWLKNQVEEMVGFNSINYDYPVLHYALTKLWHLKGKYFCKLLFNYSSSIINGKRTYFKESQYIKKQIDLFKINHYDNKARITSLKLLEFNLKLDNIQELPYKPGTLLTNSEIQVVIHYCDNDINATELLYNETLSEIELRDKLSKQYNINFTNYNSTKIGETILITKIINQLGEDVVYHKIETDRGIRKIIKNTKRQNIILNDIIFDYISFITEPFQKILKWFKSKIITETNGVFSKIPFEELNILEPYYKMQKVTGKQKTLNIVYKGFQYDFGVGGIHGSIKPGIYTSDNNYEIWDVDVASYYPNLAIKNKFYPEHFGEDFCDIYESIYEERRKYSKKTHPTENLALKLALNGSYGKSNSIYSALYDPAYTMKTTINGQLLLCMLSERFVEEIPNCRMIQINTDGMTIQIHKKYVEQMKSICKKWEDLTKLELESIKYSKMIIKDVNNYIAVSENGYVKRKGAAFIYKVTPGELELHKNFSMLIIPKALEAYFVKNIPVEEFIRNHKNMYDFFKRTKIKRSDKLYGKMLDEKGNASLVKELQRVTRYYISGYTEEKKVKINNPNSKRKKIEKRYYNHGPGVTLIKEMPPLKGKTELRNSNIEAGYLCTVCNNINKTSFEEIKSKIHYPYYINEANKIIKLIKSDE